MMQVANFSFQAFQPLVLLARSAGFFEAGTLLPWLVILLFDYAAC